MPVSAKKAKMAAGEVGSNSNGRQVQNAIQNHIEPKHRSEADLRRWLLANPGDAAMQSAGYGIRSYFTDHGWNNLNKFIEVACFFPTSMHESLAYKDSRALIYFKSPEGQQPLGSMLSLVQQNLPPGMIDPNLLWGIVLVIAVDPPALITAFPSDTPSSPKLT
jgi:hypothetical protein